MWYCRKHSRVTLDKDEPLRILLILIVAMMVVAMPPRVEAFGAQPAQIVIAQSGGKTLSQAVEDVRRQTGGRILSAQTRVQGGREVHHIKVLTKDGKVKTYKVQGRRRG